MTARRKKEPEKTLCDDWACPSMWSCARFWGRSKAYWDFDIEAPHAPLVKGPRRVGVDSCDDYERDVPREWLAGAFEPLAPMKPPPRGFKLYLVETEGQA